jgi:hypothetical protein
MRRHSGAAELRQADQAADGLSIGPHCANRQNEESDPTEATRATTLKIVKQQCSGAPQALVFEPERT